MSWPQSNDFNEAVQNPAEAFQDPDLRSGTVALTPFGVPMPRSGNYADVYQITAADGTKWAVKCFTRPTTANASQRYAAVSKHLTAANLPFAVEFQFLPQGLRVRGQWYPIVKMQWVDGFPLNQFVRDNLNRSTILENMLSLWVRLCRRLRETGLAHCDIQHGNVLLVPAEGRANSLGLKLVDYDGLFVPEMAGQPPGEAGHSSYQHPQRVATNAYSADVDRFSHLVVATALRALLVGGKTLWDKYDNGDNLLFTEKDFTHPMGSKLMRELWDTGDPFTVGLLAHLALSCGKPLAQSPWLDQLMPGGQPPILTPSQEQQAALLLGVPSVAVPAVFEPPVVAKAVPAVLEPPTVAKAVPTVLETPAVAKAVPLGRQEADVELADPDPVDDVDVEAIDEESESVVLPKSTDRPTGRLPFVPIIVGGFAFLFVVGLVAFLTSGGTPPPNVDPVATLTPTPEQKPPAEQKPPEQKPPEQKPPEQKPPEQKPPEQKTPEQKPENQPRLLWAALASPRANVFNARAEFSHDGSHLVVGTGSGSTVRILDATDGRELATFADHQPNSFIHAVPLAGGKLFSVGREPHAFVVDASTGQATGKVPLPGTGFSALHVQADRVGRFVLLANESQFVVLDLNLGEPALRGELHAGISPLTAAVLAEDGSAVLTVNPRRQIEVRALPSGGSAGSIEIDVPDPAVLGVTLLAWSPDKATAVVGFNSPQRSFPPQLLDVNTGKLRPISPSVTAFSHAAAFSADGKTLLLTGAGGIQRWNLAAGTLIDRTPLPGNFALPVHLSGSADGRRVAVTSAAGMVGVVSWTGEAPVTNVPPTVSTAPSRLQGVGIWKAADVADGPFQSFAVAPTGQVFVATETAVHRLTPGQTKPTATYRLPPKGKLHQIWATVQNVVCDQTAEREREFALLDPNTLAVTRTIPKNFKGVVKAVDVSASGTLAAVLRANGHVALVDLTGRGGFATINSEPDATRAIPSADGQRVFVAAGNQFRKYGIQPPFKFISLDTKEPTMNLEAVSLGGERFCERVAKSSGVEYVCHNLRQIELRTPGEEQSHFRYMADGSRAVVVSSTQGVLLALGEKRPPTALALKLTPPYQAAVSADGYWLAAGDSTVVHLAKLSDTPVPVVVAVSPPSQVPVVRPGDPRSVPPPADGLVAAEAKVKESHAADYAKKTPADRKRLAEKLVTEAGSTVDLTEQYVLLKEALNLNIGLHDTAAVTRVVDQLEKRFAIDGFAVKLDGFRKIAAAITEKDELRTLGESFADLSQELADKDQFDRAAAVLELAGKCYDRGELTANKLLCETRIATLKKWQSSFEALKPAVDKLKADPADPAANVQVGKFRCVVLGRWADGLPLLAKGGSDKLTELAKLDTDRSVTDSKKAEAWWTFASRQPEPDKAAYQARAKFWYGNVLASGKGGLEQAAAENRLAGRIAGNDYRPGLIGFYSRYRNATILKAVADFQFELNSQTQRAFQPNDPNMPVAFTVRWAGFIVPPTVGRYKFTADADDANFTLSIGLKGEERTVFSNQGYGKVTRQKIEGTYVLGDKPTPVNVIFEGILSPPGPRTLRLKWVRPGSTVEEIVPPTAFVHLKSDEKLLTK